MSEDTGMGTGAPNAEMRQPTPRQPQAVPSSPYVRQRPVHRTVAPINDLAQEDEPSVAHDSDFVTRGSVLSGQAYRQSRRDSQQLRRDLHYGQYLEVPKGRKDIFASRERKTRVKTAVALIAVLAVLAVVVYLLWGFMNANWGQASIG